ncbi:MAG TPA: methyltransferase domain-containing protein [Gemmatales bacterium]|nr:methyltransferase domain-containing protein [Gemmatales bacterium]
MSMVSETLIPPNGLINKFRYYSKRYGVISTLCRYVGRKSATFWKMAGPWATAGYLGRWLAEPGPRILNLGGGGNLRSDWLTADIDPRSEVYVDITRRLPFPNNSVHSVFLEEVIEHISLQDAKALLLEIGRILVPGGVVRITTPDLTYICRQLLERPHETQEINDIFYLHHHRHLYSPPELLEVSQSCGFVETLVSKYKDPLSTLGYLDSHAERFNHVPEFLQYLELHKPR